MRLTFCFGAAPRERDRRIPSERDKLTRDRLRFRDGMPLQIFKYNTKLLFNKKNYKAI